jgi:two-component system cell cycle response regulator
MFCRVLTNAPQRTTVGNMGFMDSHVIERVKELEQRSLLANTQSRLSATKGEEIERLALLDTLTDLYNSRTFLKEIKDELRRAKRYKRPVALCMISIDAFRDITRQFGALTSDAVLKSMGDVLRGAIRDVDIPARYSAEEFAIIFPETNASGASIVAERIRQRVTNQSITHNWHNLKVTASIGLASFPAHARESEELIAKTIQALELAMQRGGDRVCVV